MTRRLIILATTLFAIVIGQAQILMGWGQSPAEFAADSDATLRVAGYAFAIWGPIFLLDVVFGVAQARVRDTVLMHCLGLTDAAGFMTGTATRVDGGVSICRT
mgnify:CR=1 FL=1